jgi:antibiotic biosynthesis monooxygenase (ABM) superfamily enzyme
MKDNHRFYIEVIWLATCLMAIFMVCIAFDLAGYHPNPQIILLLKILGLFVSAFFLILTFCGLFSLWLYERRRENEKTSEC